MLIQHGTPLQVFLAATGTKWMIGRARCIFGVYFGMKPRLILQAIHICALSILCYRAETWLPAAHINKSHKRSPGRVKQCSKGGSSHLQDHTGPGRHVRVWLAPAPIKLGYVRDRLLLWMVSHDKRRPLGKRWETPCLRKVRAWVEPARISWRLRP